MSRRNQIGLNTAATAAVACLAVGFFTGRHSGDYWPPSALNVENWISPLDNSQLLNSTLSVDDLHEELRRTRSAIARKDDEMALISLNSSVEIVHARGIKTGPEYKETLRLAGQLFTTLELNFQRDPTRTDYFGCFDTLVTDFKFKTNSGIYKLNYQESLRLLVEGINDSSWGDSMHLLDDALSCARKGGFTPDKKFADSLAAVRRLHPVDAARYDANKKYLASIAKLEKSAPSKELKEVLSYLTRTVSASSYGEGYFEQDYFGAAIILYDSLSDKDKSSVTSLVAAIGADLVKNQSGANHDGANFPSPELEDIKARLAKPH